MASSDNQISGTPLNTLNPSTRSTKQIFTKIIVSSVIDWASRVKKSKRKENLKFEWSTEQREYLQSLLNHSPQFLSNAPLGDSKLKKYILKIIEKGLNKDDIETFYKNRAQFPLNLLGLEVDLANFKANEHHQLASSEKVDAGFYMLEADLSSDHSEKLERLIIKSLEPVHRFEVKTIQHKTFKRLIYLSKNTVLILQGKPRLFPDAISQFKLIPITRNFFLSRLLKKIGESASQKKLQSVDDRELLRLWHQYDAIFKEVKPVDAYDHFLEKIEPLIIPSKEKQLSQLKIWRIKAK